MIVALIIACEVGFWVLLALALAVRYLLRWRRTSVVLLLCEPVLELVLFVVTAIDLKNGAEPSWDQVWALAEKKKKSVEPPPSSDQREVKTRVDGRRARQASAQRLTSPVPLVPSSDHSPGWLPPPSRRGAVPSSVVELAMTSEEAQMLEQLAADQALSPADVVRQLVRQAYARRSQS